MKIDSLHVDLFKNELRTIDEIKKDLELYEL